MKKNNNLFIVLKLISFFVEYIVILCLNGKYINITSQNMLPFVIIV